MKDFLDSGETIWIWYSDAPYPKCGFYSLCQMLKGYDNEVRAVRLPEYVVHEKAIVSYQSWNEVAAEEFYDFLIWKWLKGVPLKEARLIGDILGHSQLGVGDWWYAKRIEHYIRQGKICVVENSENKYARTILAAEDTE